MPPMKRNMKPMRKPKDAKKAIIRILKYMSQYKFHLILVILGIILNSIATILGNYLLKPIINGLTQNSHISVIYKPLMWMAVFYSLGVIGNYMYSRIMLKISTGTLYKIRTDLFCNMQKLKVKHFDMHTHGELMSRFTSDTDTLREMLANGIPQLFSSAITIVGVFFAMLFLSPVLTSLIILMLFVMLFVIKTIGAKSGYYFKDQQKNNGAVNGYVEEMIEGLKVVKIFNREKEVTEKFKVLNENLCKSATNAHICANILMPIMGNLSYMNYAITAGVGGFLVIKNLLDIGTIASFLQYTRTFSHPITQISQQFNSILNALAGAERIFEIIDMEKEVDNGDVTLVYVTEKDGVLFESQSYTGTWAWKVPNTDNSFSLVKLLGDVRFNNVTFGYNENKTVLKNVSLYAKPGQKIALVGSTGAGKTTITNLLNRFYDITDGEITYDGIDIKRIKKDALRSSLAMVLQDTHLFTGTVRDNIRYGKLDATDEEVENAARLANAHTFIMNLPDGYDTFITGDGASLSQGQRQLLAIARAAVANPPVLVLDEATSSIDTRTEKLIEKGMNTLMKGRTVFVIAHRLSTVRNSDAIMVLENGEIIERGDHDDLLKQQGKYYKLYTGMFELS